MNTSQNTPLTELFQNFEIIMAAADYKPLTVNAYASALRRLERYCACHGKCTYDEGVVANYLNEIAGLYENGKMSWSFMRLARKSTHLLIQLAEEGEFSFDRYSQPIKPLGNYYEDLLSGFRSYLDFYSNVTTKVKKRKIRECRKFFSHLESIGIWNVVDITLKIADAYATDAANRLGVSAMGNIYNSLRGMCKYLEQANIPYFDFSPALNMRPAKRTKVMPAFSKAQVKAISEAIDFDLSTAKRDFALLKIAETYGMRATDIAGLKLTDIRWKMNEIRITQSKTGVELVLPLKVEVGNAIVDYILQERPKAESEYIFLRALAPYEAINPETVLGRLVKYMDKSNVSHNYGNGLGTHSYRRYVASQMLDKGVPMDTVSQVLGHTNIISLKPYIRVSQERLRNCALDLSHIKLTGGLLNELSI